MTTRPAVKEASRAFILEMRRAGFTQLRRTNSGYLYGSGTYRMEVPYSVVQGSATLSYVEELRVKFDLVRQQRDAEFGKPNVKFTEGPIAPFPNPDDLLHEEGGPPVEGARPVQLADEGSTPSPLAIPTEADARLGPGIATPAPEGSSPSVGTITGIPAIDDPDSKWKFGPAGHLVRNPNPGGETTMPPKKRKAYEPWTCPKCGDTFKMAGRHSASCDGKKREARTKGVEEPKASVTRVGRNTKNAGMGTVVSLNGFKEVIETFQEASNNMVTVIKAALEEAAIYKKERDELAAWKQQLTQVMSR